MARIAGIELPRGKRADIALTYIYGIGRATALQILDATGVNWTRNIDDLDADEVNEIRKEIETNHKVEGDLRRGSELQYQASYGYWLLSWSAASSRPARARPAHPHQRPHPQRAASRRRGQKEVRVAAGARRPVRRA